MILYSQIHLLNSPVLHMESIKKKKMLLFKENRSKQGWVKSETIVLAKQLKKAMKQKLQENIEEGLKKKCLEYGPISLPICIALNEFSSLLDKVRASSDPDVLQEVLNETCFRMDDYYKNNGILKKDLASLYFQISRSQEEGIPPLYHNSEEYYIKMKKMTDDKLGPNIELDPSIRPRLINMLTEICRVINCVVRKNKKRKKAARFHSI